MTKLAALNHGKACQLAERLENVKGCHVINDTFFNEFTVRLDKPASKVIEDLAKKDILAGVGVRRLYQDRPELDELMLIAVTETVSDQDIELLVHALTEELA